MLSEKQVHRLFALSESIKKLPQSRYNEGYNAAKQFLVDNGLTTSVDPIQKLHKVKSSYKMKALKIIVNKNQDYYNLYKNNWVTDKDILHYLNVDKIKKG